MVKSKRKLQRTSSSSFTPFLIAVTVLSVCLVGIYGYLLGICVDCDTNEYDNSIKVGLIDLQKRFSFRQQIDEDLVCDEYVSVNYRCDNGFHLPTSFNGQDVLCEHDTVTDLKYLPEVNFQKCVTKYPSKEWKDDQEELFDSIKYIQNPSDCNVPNSKEYTKPTWFFSDDEKGFPSRTKRDDFRSQKDFEDENPKWNLIGWLHHGYAYNLFILAWNAGNHWSSGVSVITSYSKYRFSDMECGKSWSCYWSPLSKCELRDIKNESVLVYYETSSPRNVMSVAQLCQPNGYYDYFNGRCVCDEGFMPSRFDEYTGCAPYHSFDFENIPRRNIHRQKWESINPKTKYRVREGDDYYFSLLAPSENNPGLGRNPVHFTASELRDKYGFLWEHAQWLWYLHKDNPKTKFLDEYISDSGLDLAKVKKNEIRTVGVHVRHGDSCHDRYQNHRVCLPLSSYMEAVKELEDTYGKFDIIFLATDDPAVIADTKVYEAKGYTFAYQKISREMYETGDSNGVDVRYEFNEPQIVKEIVADIWGISHCDAFVGSFASSVAWVAYELMLARHGFYPPFISVDMPYAHKKNVGRFFY